MNSKALTKVIMWVKNFERLIMNNGNFLYAKYTSSLGNTFKGVVSLSEGFLTFKNKEKIIVKLDKEDISSFEIKNTFFTKCIFIRVKGRNYKFQINTETKTQIVNFLKN